MSSTISIEVILSLWLARATGLWYNALQFTEEGFSQIMQENGFKHILCVLHMIPLQNGLADDVYQLSNIKYRLESVMDTH